MADYLIRNVPANLWADFKARALKDGHSLKYVLCRLIARYLEHGL